MLSTQDIGLCMWHKITLLGGRWQGSYGSHVSFLSHASKNYTPANFQNGKVNFEVL
jgi:hypothetical protein